MSWPRRAPINFEHSGLLWGTSYKYFWRSADCLQVSLKTVQRIRTLQTNDEIDRTRKYKREAKKSLDVPEAVKHEVRDVIYDMYRRKIYITLDSLLDEINLRQIWPFKRTSLWKLIKSMGFMFKKTNHRVGLCEQSHIVALRQIFLKKYITNLSSEFPLKIYFLDETWIFSKGKWTTFF